ncbi:hypothetical protein JOC78_000330 [Bacillus ectoiniformans]|uniref:DinB family protein n=1 Tax=Bacillus ectoiniformans TaxID=1494429 RepID=UPI0019563861|nr:DinB family protein [Bacillus ectoiniformans]MBM7647409.1 hypothetical protein [Bacillus ectoiniformans]
MEQHIFKHMDTIRAITLNVLNEVPEEKMAVLPPGFNNHILWNAGHIAFVQEKIVLGLSGDEGQLTPSFEEFFGAGTKPADWEGTPPSIKEVKEALINLPKRIKETMAGRIAEPLKAPYTNKTGVTFTTVADALFYSFYHEALHLEKMKLIMKHLL